MVNTLSSTTFSKKLIDWYHKHGRHNLPWQRDQTPYRVWISEIMLQQTQVTTVIGYFQRFMRSFPTLKKLALADEDFVLSHWSGLGYYARARNLHRAAQVIHHQFSGRFPKSIEGLMALPGIGASTAGAILSFAYQLPTPICDGNVKRVLARLFAIDKPKTDPIFWEYATGLTPTQNTHHYNQAIMDLGATICTRTKPACKLCPMQNDCLAHLQGRESYYPIKQPKKATPIKSIQMLILEADNGILLYKRPTEGIWGGLWCFPECSTNINALDWCREHYASKIENTVRFKAISHKFTHFTLNIRPLHVKLKVKRRLPTNPPHHWHQQHLDLPGGICAPVSKLLKLVL